MRADLVDLDDPKATHEAARRIMRRSGLFLVALGFFKLGLTIYQVLLRHQPTFGVDIVTFALLIMGAWLLRGSLAAARISAWLVATQLTVILLPLALAPVMPLDLFLLQHRLNPMASFLSWSFSIIMYVGYVWTYRMLRSPIMVEERQNAGLRSPPPYTGWAGGIVFLFAVGITTYQATHGEDAARAIDIARSSGGSLYRYHVAKIFVGEREARAQVIAFDDREMKTIDVEWQR